MREIIFSSTDYADVKPLYFVAYLVADSTYVNGTDLEAYNAAHWTAYAIALTLDEDTGEYFGDFPSAQPGRYFVTIYERAAGAAATTDAILAEGELDWSGDAIPSLPAQFAADDDVFFNLNEFAEQVTYNVFGGSSIGMAAIVDRHVPASIREDGHNVADEIEVSIRNDPDKGVTAIAIGRDTITVAWKIGETPKARLITTVVNSDAGVWRLRLR